MFYVLCYKKLRVAIHPHSEIYRFVMPVSLHNLLHYYSEFFKQSSQIGIILQMASTSYFYLNYILTKIEMPLTEHLYSA